MNLLTVGAHARARCFMFSLNFANALAKDKHRKSAPEREISERGEVRGVCL